MDLNRKLSPHFTLREMVHTSHRHIDNMPDAEIIANLERLCREFLEPCRAVFGPLWVTSGYRSPELNRAIGGSLSSAHMFGCAADVVPIGPASTTDIVNWFVTGSGLDYDQVIDEQTTTSMWVHIGMAKPGSNPRNMALTMRHGIYSKFSS